MLIVNWSGLSRFYWLPMLKWEFGYAKHGLWYFEVRLFCFQTTLYSVGMGAAIVESINTKSKKEIIHDS